MQSIQCVRAPNLDHCSPNLYQANLKPFLSSPNWTKENSKVLVHRCNFNNTEEGVVWLR